MFKKILKTILPLSIIFALFFTQNTFAYTTKLNEDFEINHGGDGLSANGAGGDYDSSGNYYRYAERTSSSANTSNYIRLDNLESPADYFFTSVDFMIPEENVPVNPAIVLLTDWQGSNANIGSMIYDNGSIKWGTLSTPTSTVIATGIETGRWYNAFMYIDVSDTTINPKVIAHVGSEGTELEGKHPFGFNNVSYVGRWFMLGMPATSIGKVCFDNLMAIATTPEQKDTDLHLMQTRSKVVCASEGYTYDLYLPGSKSKFFKTYDSIVAEIEGQTLDATEQSNIIERIDRAYADFENSKISASNQDPAAAFIVLDEDFPETVAIEAEGSEEIILSADVKKKNAETTTEFPIVWTEDCDDNRVSITDNKLTVKSGFNGEFRVTATVTNEDNSKVTASKVIKVVTKKAIIIDEFKAEDNVVTVKGSFNEAVEGDATIDISGEDDGNADTVEISINDVVEIAEDNSFIYTAEIPENTPCQKLTVKISHPESSDKTHGGYYYSPEWESVLLAEFNNCSQESLKDVITLHNGKLIADIDVLNSSTDDYCERLVKNRPYGDLDDFESAMAEANLMVGFAQVTRAEVEDLITSYSSLLEENGFDPETIGDISSRLQSRFYLNAALIEIDGVNAAVEELCKELEKIMRSIRGASSSGGSGSGSTNTSASKSSKPSTIGTGTLGNYGVALVAGTSAGADPKPDTVIEVKQFDDVAEGSWSYDALLYMRRNGIMEGDGLNVRPKDMVTRGEFAKIIVTAFKLTGGDDTSAFTDGNGTWWDSYARIAAAHNIVNGLGDGRYGGDEVINREMLAVMIDRVIKANSIELYDQNDGISFDDAAYISDYAKESIDFLAKKGVISGIGDGMYAPGLSVTREEAAQIVYNVLKQF